MAGTQLHLPVGVSGPARRAVLRAQHNSIALICAGGGAAVVACGAAGVCAAAGRAQSRRSSDSARSQLFLPNNKLAHTRTGRGRGWRRTGEQPN